MIAAVLGIAFRHDKEQGIVSMSPEQKCFRTFLIGLSISFTLTAILFHLEGQNFKEIRTSKYNHYRKKARILFWAHWLSFILGHFGIILGLLFLSTTNHLWLIASPFAFKYYFRGMSKLRKKRLSVLLARDSYKQEFAEEILASGKPYAVYLREFKNENSSVGEFGISHGLGEETETLGVKIRPGHVEFIISQILNKDMPLISLADPQNPPVPGSHRFLNIPEDWEALIEKLLTASNPVFIYITSFFSRGLNQELQILKERQLFDRTIVIFGRELSHIELRASRDKQYKNVVYDTGAKQYLRRHERKLQKNLKDLVAAYEVKTNQQGKFLSEKRKKIPFVTPLRLFIALKLVVPALCFFIVVLIFLSQVVYPDIPSYDMPIANLGIMLVIYILLRCFTGINLHDRYYRFVEENKLKSLWNSRQNLQSRFFFAPDGFSKPTAFKLKMLGIYQVAGGIIGLGSQFWITTGIRSLYYLHPFFLIPVILYAYSIYCGTLLLKRKISLSFSVLAHEFPELKGVLLLKKKMFRLNHSMANQLLQLLHFSISGYNFYFISGIFFSMGFQKAPAPGFGPHFGISFCNVTPNWDKEFFAFNLNLVALGLIFFIQRLKKKVREEHNRRVDL